MCVCCEVLEGHKGTGGSAVARGSDCFCVREALGAPLGPAGHPHRGAAVKHRVEVWAAAFHSACTMQGPLVPRADDTDRRTDGGEES